MRGTWIILVLLAVVPALGYLVLDATGRTSSFRLISTTAPEAGTVSTMDFVLLPVCLACWLCLKVFWLVFLLAAVPFLVGDLWRTLRKRKADP